MNNKVKNSIRDVGDSLAYAVTATAQSIVSLIRICLLSSFRTALKSKRYIDYRLSDNCYVLGNGPSLKDVLLNGEIGTGEGDLFCVNMFCTSEYFWKLKPRFYLLCDGEYFNPSTERTKTFVEELIKTFNKVDWQLFLIIPPSIPNNCHLLSYIDNPSVNILRNNSAEVSGFKWFRHLFYQARLGMPRCQTVINYALMTAINMRYNNVFLYGAEHSWTKNMWVGDDNKLYTGDPHLYDSGNNMVPLPNGISVECSYLSMAFRAHELIRSYSDSINVKIVNKTKGSFIDAYERD